MHQVATVRFEQGGDRDRLVKIDPSRCPITGGNPNQQGTLPGATNDVKHRKGKAHAVFQRTSVLVGAPIGEGRDEAGDEIAVREVELQGIEPAAGRRLCRQGKDLHDMCDVAHRHLFRQRRVRRVGDGRSRHQLPPALPQRPVDTLRAWPHRAAPTSMTQL